MHIFCVTDSGHAQSRSRLIQLLLLIACVMFSSGHTLANDMAVLSDSSEAGVKETRFDIVVDGVTVPAILWTPEGASGTRPLMVFGHGGQQHKRVSNILRMARDFVITEHYAALAIDGYGHGERAPLPDAESSEPRRAENMTAETMAAISAVQNLDYVGQGPVGYWGVSMGTRFGVPLVANDDRFTAALFGLFGLFPEGSTVPVGWGDDARNINIPLIFVYQRSDSLMTLESGIDLFDAFGSSDKTMHINPGGHVAIPVSEREKWKPFFVSHLGKAKVQAD